MNDENRNYGTRSDQIHEFFKAKREWSKVKDKIVGSYIACYLKTVQHRGRPIIIVDAFSGPGRFGDGSDGSPLIICKTIEKMPKCGVGVACLFSDSHPTHRAAVEAVKEQPMKRPQIYEAIVPKYFLHYRSKDYRAMIDNLVFKENKLFGDPRTLKRKNQLNDQTLISVKPWT